MTVQLFRANHYYLFIWTKSCRNTTTGNSLKRKRELRQRQKSVNFGEAVDNEGLTAYFKHMYYKVDIYDNNVFLMTANFLSPIANSAPTFYKFFITDTVVVNNQKLVELSFTPRNTTDILFVG